MIFLTTLVSFSFTLVLKPSFSQSLSLLSHLSLAHANLEFDHLVFWQSLAEVVLATTTD